MTDTNQKLREALQAISHIDDSTNHAVDASAALDRIGKIARQALAMPTADHIPDAGEMVVDHLPDAGKMIETAAPVGELPELPEAYGYFDIRGSAADGYTADQMRAYARAALSAGDAEDAQRLDFIEKSARCDPKMDGQHVWWPTSLNKALKGPTLRDAIDAAMRKGQL